MTRGVKSHGPFSRGQAYSDNGQQAQKRRLKLSDKVRYMGRRDRTHNDKQIVNKYNAVEFSLRCMELELELECRTWAAVQCIFKRGDHAGRRLAA